MHARRRDRLAAVASTVAPTAARAAARTLLWVSVAALLASCAGRGAPRPAEPFTGFRTSDGFRIAADLHVPDGVSGERPAPLVALGHQVRRDRRAWDPLVPILVEAGYAVLTVDHRGFGESTDEVSSPGALTELQRSNLPLDLIQAIDAVSGRPGVDATRIAVVGTGLSVTPAVQCAQDNPNVRCLVLFTGLIAEAQEDFLFANPDFPILLLAAAGDTRGVGLARQYAARFTGEAQHYVEVEAYDRSVADDWVGSDGIQADTGVAELILWFLELTIDR